MCVNNPQETLDNQSGISRKRDICTWLYVFWTGAVFLLLYFAHTINMVFELGILILPVIGILAFIWVVILLICLIKNILMRHWRRVAFIIALPIIIGLFFKMFYLLNITPERIRLEGNRFSYMKEIAEFQVEDNSPHLKTWSWGIIPVFPAGITYYILLYDDSDQISMPPQSRTAAWKRSFALTRHSQYLSSDPENWNERLIIKHINGHFYLIINDGW